MSPFNTPKSASAQLITSNVSIMQYISIKSILLCKYLKTFFTATQHLQARIRLISSKHSYSKNINQIFYELEHKSKFPKKMITAYCLYMYFIVGNWSLLSQPPLLLSASEIIFHIGDDFYHDKFYPKNKRHFTEILHLKILHRDA